MANFRVIIVGGGIGGLTLANCLQHANIDFVLLESREEIGMHFGAGVGVSTIPISIASVALGCGCRGLVQHSLIPRSSRLTPLHAAFSTSSGFSRIWKASSLGQGLPGAPFSGMPMGSTCLQVMATH